MLYHLNQSGVGLRHFFTLKIDSEILGTNTGKTYRLDQRIVDWTSRTAFKKAVLKGVENLFQVIKHK